MIRRPAATLIQLTALLAAGCTAEGPSERVMPAAAQPDPDPAPIVEYTVNTGPADEESDGSVQSFGMLETVEVPAQEPEGEAPGDLSAEEALEAGRSAWESGEYARAARMLRVVVEGGAGRPYDGYLLGLSLWKSGQPAAAEPYLVDASWKMPEFVRAPVNLARVRIELGQLFEAEEAIDTALAVDDGFGPAHNVRGRILLERGAVDEALEAFQKAAELDGDDPWPLNNAGYALILRDDFAKAVDPLEEAISRDLSHAVIWNNLALAREGAGDLPGAVEAAARAAELEGDGAYQVTYERLAALTPAAPELPAEVDTDESTEEIASADR